MRLNICGRRQWAAAALFYLSVGALAGPAAAQPTQAQQNALRSNCRSDFMAHCSSVKPGGIEALQCLQRNVAKLSSGCQSAVNALSPPAAPKQAAPAAPPPTAAPPTAVAAPTAPAAPPAHTTAAHPPASAPPPRQPSRAATPPPAAKSAKPTAQQQAAIKQSCQSDFMSRCRGVQPGGQAALQCLQRNAAHLSPNCRSAVAALGGGAPAAVTTPAAAPAATAAMPDAASTPTPAQQSAVRFTCRRDFTVYCRGVPQGGPEAFACLQQNAARLSPDCRTSIAAIAQDAPTEPAAAPAGRKPIGPLRRAIRDRMMGQ
jgi:hypothetical protein